MRLRLGQIAPFAAALDLAERERRLRELHERSRVQLAGAPPEWN